MILPQPSEILQPLADRLAISLSALCVMHCLLMPLTITLLPSLAALGLDDEAFHIWLLIVVMPVSLFALTLGCSRHRNYKVLLLGLFGLAVLCAPMYLGHAALGRSGEVASTLVGALMIALSHWRNYALCQSQEACDCSH